MNAKNALLGILGISFLIELAMAAGGFLAPAKTVAVFGVGDSPDVRFLAHVIAWMILLITIVCGYAACLVHRDVKAGWGLSYILGFWWVGIGLALCCGFGRTDNLFLDTLKGALIVGTAYASRPRA